LIAAKISIDFSLFLFYAEKHNAIF